MRGKMSLTEATDNEYKIQNCEKESFGGKRFCYAVKAVSVPPLLKAQKSREGEREREGWLNSLVNEGLFLALDKPGGARTMKLGRIY